MRMRVLIIYFSVTGTTRRVAESIAEGLEAEGVQVVLHDLRGAPDPDARGFDLIGLGSPVHYYRLPQPVTHAIRSLGDCGGTPGFTFVLNATYRGAGLNQARAELARAGIREIGVYTCNGEGRFLGYTRMGYRFSPGHPTPADLDAARDFGARLVAASADAAEGRPLVPDSRDARTRALYALERAASNPWLARHLYARYFRVDERYCTRCGRCAATCPVGNVSWRPHELPCWGRECILCLACEESCPQDAISSPADWAVFRPFYRLNVARALRDPNLEHTRVPAHWRKSAHKN
jgi:flavodoxin/NAD-dependent dihydropyrimidine dehydrogenase PreA subunit